MAASGGKLSEALGFGEGLSAGPVVSMPGGQAREPKRAFAAPVASDDEIPSNVPTARAVLAHSARRRRGGCGRRRGRRRRPPTDPLAARGAAGPVATPFVRIAAGSFTYGEDRRALTVGAFEIQRDPVTNAEYERFVVATGHRPALYWRGGVCPDDLRDHPVVGVDYFDAMAYARWAGLDLPFEDEWERAARGTDARTYPWGDEPDLAANTARTGLKMTLPVGFHPKNVSPDGCRDMVGNAWELTHSPAPGGGLVVRGGSWFDFALYAKTYFRSSARADARNGTIGFRCVKREGLRAGVARAVTEAELEPGVAARKSKGELPDPNAWSPERRDLVPDLRRLRAVVASRDEEAGAEQRLAAASGPLRPSVRKAFGASAAAVPTPSVSTQPARAAPPEPATAPPVTTQPARPAAQVAPTQPGPPRRRCPPTCGEPRCPSRRSTRWPRRLRRRQSPPRRPRRCRRFRSRCRRLQRVRPRGRLRRPRRC